MKKTSPCEHIVVWNCITVQFNKNYFVAINEWLFNFIKQSFIFGKTNLNKKVLLVKCCRRWIFSYNWFIGNCKYFKNIQLYIWECVITFSVIVIFLRIHDSNCTRCVNFLCTYGFAYQWRTFCLMVVGYEIILFHVVVWNIKLKNSETKKMLNMLYIIFTC